MKGIFEELKRRNVIRVGIAYAVVGWLLVQMTRGAMVCAVIGLVLITQPVNAQPKDLSAREAMYYRYMEFAKYVKGGSIEPHWMVDESSFWYLHRHCICGECHEPGEHCPVAAREPVEVMGDH